MSFLTDAVSAVTSWFGAEQQNRRSADAAAQAQEFSAAQFASRYQTTVKDMEAAGLNPMLAYSQGGGSPPSGVVANVPANSGASASEGYFRSRMNNAQIDLVEAQKDSVSAQAAKTRAETLWIEPSAMADIDLKHSSAGQSRQSIDFMRSQASKIAEEIRNIPIEGERLRALVLNLKQSTDLMEKQGLTQQEIALQTRWLARKAMLDGDLVNLDIKAANSFDNLGREAGQLKPIVDIVKSLLRR